MVFLSSALLGFLAVAAVSRFYPSPDRRMDFRVGASLPILILLIGPVSLAIIHARPTTVDGALRAADLSLGLDGFALARLVARTGLERWLFAPAYLGLPFMMAMAWLASRSKTLLFATVIGLLLVGPLYLLVPAAGPAYAFAGFPSAAATLVRDVGFHPRNCFPSMHVTWALLLALNVSGRKRWAFAAFALVTAMATISTGEHYVVDVLVAVPYTLAVQFMAERAPKAWAALSARHRAPLPTF